MTQPLDKNVSSVMRKMQERAAKGLLKYGVTTERTDLSRLDWLVHHQQELMDACIYVERQIADEEAALNESYLEHVQRRAEG